MWSSIVENQKNPLILIYYKALSFTTQLSGPYSQTLYGCFAWVQQCRVAIKLIDEMFCVIRTLIGSNKVLQHQHMTPPAFQAPGSGVASEAKGMAKVSLNPSNLQLPGQLGLSQNNLLLQTLLQLHSIKIIYYFLQHSKVLDSH